MSGCAVKFAYVGNHVVHKVSKIGDLVCGLFYIFRLIVCTIGDSGDRKIDLGRGFVGRLCHLLKAGTEIVFSV